MPIKHGRDGRIMFTQSYFMFGMYDDAADHRIWDYVVDTH